VIIKANTRGEGLSVVILTFNSEATIIETIEAARKVSNDIHAVDSFSTDATVSILHERGVTVIQRPFENYGGQRNWAINNLPLRHAWQLHLDSDERLSDELVREINSLQFDATSAVSGYFIPRLVHFMGKPIRHGAMYPIWHLRLFLGSEGRCEDRLYDQHFYVGGATAKLSGAMIDDIRMPLSEWVIRHNRWSDAQVRAFCAEASTRGEIGPKMFGTPIQRKRRLRSLYNKSPLFVRAFLLFFYRYVIRFGFLDGTPGLVFFVLQTFWFHFLVDAKLYERSRDLPRREVG
jgi:glycosyltransferase involved in cell wall biosynthesis